MGRSLPQALKEILRKSLEKEPENRIESAARFKDEIQKIQAELSGFHTSIPIPPAAVPAAAQPPPKPTRGVVTKVAVIVGVSLILVAAILTVGLVYYSRAKTELADAFQQNLAVNVIKDGLKKRLEGTGGKSAPAAAVKDTVRIEFLNIPPGGRIMQGDTEIVGTVAEVEKGVSATFLIKAEGYEERKIRIVPLENGTIDAALEPLKKTGAGKAGTSKSQEHAPAKNRHGAGMEYVP